MAQPKTVPRFEDFAVRETFAGKPAAPQLTAPRARRYRTAINDRVSNGPNFAGYYTLAEWSCGPMCASFAIVDARSGRLYLHPSLQRVYLASFDQNDDLLQFRLDSRLLIVAGARNGKGSGIYYYVWDGRQLRLARARHCKFNLEAPAKARC